MKLRLLLSLSLVAFLATFSLASAASFDSETATIQKSTAHTAKIMVGKETYTAPISFGEDADWTSVKDHYEVNDSVVSGLKKHKIAISIGSDGKASFTRKK
jgi:hypothetical protein